MSQWKKGWEAQVGEGCGRGVGSASVLVLGESSSSPEYLLREGLLQLEELQCQVQLRQEVSQPSQDLLHSSYFCLYQVTIRLVAEWIASGCLKLGSIHSSFKRPFVKYPHNSSWAMNKHPKHESKMRHGRDGNVNTVPLWPRPSFRSMVLEAIFCLGFSALVSVPGAESLFCGAHQKWVWKSPFCRKALPVMKRAFHSPWIGPEKRAAATLWKAGPNRHFLCCWAGKAARESSPQQRRRCRGQSGWSSRLCQSWAVDQWGGQLWRRLGHPSRFRRPQDKPQVAFVRPDLYFM